MSNAASPALRWLAAALCLLASCAFALRETNPAGGMATHAMPMGCDEGGTAHSPGPRPEPSAHDHAGHCPFCFTGGFALEAGEVAAPASFAVRAGRAPPTRAQARAATFPHADARAPPHLIARSSFSPTRAAAFGGRHSPKGFRR